MPDGAEGRRLSSRQRSQQRRLPKSLRRAEDYIAAHAHKPITPASIAEAAGCSVRTLQAIFREHRGTTPLGALKRFRLQCVRAELSSLRSNSSISAIVQKWHLGNPGRFAADYRRMFGENPSQTLRFSVDERPSS
jgi:AraC-like DNA-binding protein